MQIMRDVEGSWKMMREVVVCSNGGWKGWRGRKCEVVEGVVGVG